MSLLDRLFGKADDKAALRPLYDAIVAEARRPAWYRDGKVPDTLDGRFEMVAAVLSLLLIRLEDDGEAGKAPSTRLTEIFVDDMDGQLREIGIGDIVVGKHIGRMMSALGGRLGAYRAALAPGADGDLLRAALLRNVYRGQPPGSGAIESLIAGLRALFTAIGRAPLDTMLAGGLAGGAAR